MNYGYDPLVPADQPPVIDEADETERFCIQLYYHVAGAVRLEGCAVLDIGCGRGGGARYIKNYLGASTVIGLDDSEKVVALCRRHHTVEGLSFVAGDAEALPFEDESFDAVVNTESSHCFCSMETFLAETRRVFRPGGHLLIADFRPVDTVEKTCEHLLRSGMRLVRKTDITPNVLSALTKDSARRTSLIESGARGSTRKMMMEFSGAVGSNIYNRFSSGRDIYLSFVLKK